MGDFFGERWRLYCCISHHHHHFLGSKYRRLDPRRREIFKQQRLYLMMLLLSHNSVSSSLALPFIHSCLLLLLLLHSCSVLFPLSSFGSAVVSGFPEFLFHDLHPLPRSTPFPSTHHCFSSSDLFRLPLQPSLVFPLSWW